MARQPRSLNEWVVLALLVEQPSHGFAIARALTPDSDLGRILTVRRPLVYRALDRLVGAALVEPVQVEPGDAGPNRTVYRSTARGRAAVDRWLATPVDHVRELRVGFLVKLRLLERRGRSRRALVTAQRAALDDTLRHLAARAEDGGGDVVDRWRAANARAVGSFLDGIDAARSG